MLRDSNRTLQLKLRDIEVANDDFERQARNTTSSLEDLESKYNVSIERGVMMEEEIKIGEQEREQLRIDAQRLREELADLKIEAELLQDKVKKHESRHLSAISTDLSAIESPIFDKNVENSPDSTASSPLISTPTEAKAPSSADLIQDPPSPPMSDASASLRKAPVARTPGSSMQRKTRLPSADQSVTPKPKQLTASTTKRPPGARVSSTSTPAAAAIRTPASRTTGARAASHKIPASNSLSHIRSLTAQMQRLEARVQSARSKLPAPASTPPRPSPRSSVHGATGSMPSSVTIRSRKRTVGSSASSSVRGSSMTGGPVGGAGDADTTPTNTTRRVDDLQAHSTT